MAGDLTTPCPECGCAVARGPRAKMYRAKRCDACADARVREHKRKYKLANRERTRAAERVPNVAGRKVNCQGCGTVLVRSGSRGPDPKWCPECRIARDAAAQADYRARHPQEIRDRSKVCAARRRAAAQISAEVVDRAVVYQRDGWLCGLCGDGVDKRLAWPDPMSPSLDHVMPLSLGGHHVYANVQLAHLRCNLVKGNRVEVAS